MRLSQIRNTASCDLKLDLVIGYHMVYMKKLIGCIVKVVHMTKVLILYYRLNDKSDMYYVTKKALMSEENAFLSKVWPKTAQSDIYIFTWQIYWDSTLWLYGGISKIKWNILKLYPSVALFGPYIHTSVSEKLLERIF